MPKNVLIVSASMGGGHNGVARELGTRLRERGHKHRIVDFLDAFPGPTGRMWQRTYQLEMRYAPGMYERSYSLFVRHPMAWRPFVAFETALAKLDVLRWIGEEEPDVIVSVYPFSSLVLGQLRHRGLVDAPVITFLTDFGIHPRWIHPGVDLHLAVHPQPAAEAARQVPGPCRSVGAVVPPEFAKAWADRERTRTKLGLTADDRLVLVVAGSWGVGEVEQTVRAIASDGRYQVLTICGTNDRLRRRLEHHDLGPAIGWTSEMAALMGAADALVENAGGLSAMEALVAGVPVVSFHPIAGHGIDNAREMARAGVSCHAKTTDELLAVLDRVTRPTPDRERLLAGGELLRQGDPVQEILDLAEQRIERLTTASWSRRARTRKATTTSPSGRTGRGARAG